MSLTSTKTLAIEGQSRILQVQDSEEKTQDRTFKTAKKEGWVQRGGWVLIGAVPRDRKGAERREQRVTATAEHHRAKIQQLPLEITTTVSHINLRYTTLSISVKPR